MENSDKDVLQLKKMDSGSQGDSQETMSQKGLRGKLSKPLDEPEDDFIKKKREKLEFPKTIEGFKYEFNEEGQLRHIDTGEPFEFVDKPGDVHHNQMRYEALGEVITEHVYDLLETDCKLERLPVPINSDEKEDSQTFIFASKGALDKKDKLMILIHGDGVVRAGQWARRLIINDSLNSGTQIPFIKRALEDDYGVLLLNTNDNYVLDGLKRVPITESPNPESHAIYVWDNYVSKSPAKHIVIVAHSYGGVVAVNLVNEREKALERIFAVAFTDSVHSLVHQGATPKVVNFFQNHSQNWISSTKPLDTPITSRHKTDCPCVSAGHAKHEMTSWSSFKSIFKFVDARLKKRLLELAKKEEL